MYLQSSYVLDRYSIIFNHLITFEETLINGEIRLDIFIKLVSTINV